MIVLGITGGMGSGKSVVCELLRLHEIPVFDADKEAKRLNDTSPKIKEGLSRLFGESVYERGRLNRKRLAELIFDDARNLSQANAIIHPVLADYFLAWCRERENNAIVAIDAAVLFEAGFERYVDRVLMVFSDKETRVKRVMKRDQMERQHAEARMQHQMPEEEKIQRADFVIHNDDRHSLILQVAGILKKLKHTP